MQRPTPPPLRKQTSTLWYYPSAQYSIDEPQGTPGYPGATPPWIIWNLLERYTREGDLVIDPFCGGGTTMDVARSLGREARGFDVNPQREEIEDADARKLPVEDGTVDFVFMDPPYSTHIEYSDSPNCIGKLSGLEEEYYKAMQQVFQEAHRVLKDRRYLAVFVSDSFEKGKGFAPIAARLSMLLENHFRPIDHIAVVRGNRKLEKPTFHKGASEGNFFMRGFTHLLLFKKER
ncbi:MAG: DNA methyltransferase [Planctomycetota bacterium]|nr:DNA methyltransferase [Planctomycetota bacterium]